MNKRKYVEVTLADKLKALRELEMGASQRNVALQYGVASGTVALWVTKKQEITKAAAENANTSSKRATRITGLSETLDERVYSWFSVCRSKNLPVSGPMLQTQARKTAEILGMADFVATNGWLESFRRRHNIGFKTLSGESAEINQSVVNNWKANVMFLLRDVELKDIWNFDETGLFFKGVPGKSVVHAGELARGGKIAKERFTLGLMCSALGEKFKPIVIGKSKMPRAFNRHTPTSVIW